MFRYYLGIAIMCALFAIFGFLLSDKGAIIAIVFFALSGLFMVVSFLTTDQKSRW